MRHYASVKVYERRHPFDDYHSIVLRHICHEGEGACESVVSVGLRPADKGQVLWIRSFPTTTEEIPQAAYDFARELHDKTGLELEFFQ